MFKVSRKNTSVSTSHPAHEMDHFFQKKGDQSFLSDYSSGPFFFAKGHAGHPTIQTKITVGQLNDKYEREADAIADKVVQRHATPDVTTKKETSGQAKTTMAAITPLIQRKCATCEKEEELQRKEEDLSQDSLVEVRRKPIFEGNAEPPDENDSIQRKCAECEKEERLQMKPNSSDSVTVPSNFESTLKASKGGGTSIPTVTKEKMENSFGADFSHVRLHNDTSSMQMNKALHAQAFTLGSDIYFNSGKYDTESAAGKHLLAHELTHVVQQGGTVDSQVSVAQRVTNEGPVYRKNVAFGNSSALFSNPSLIQRQPDAPGEDSSGVKSPVVVPLPTFDFNDKRQEFGRFDARYTPVGPVPAEGTLEIDLWVHIIFEDFSAKRRKKDPYKNFKFTKDQLKDFTWKQEEKEKFESDFMASVQNAWSSKFKFRLKDPAFAEYLSKVQVNVMTVNDPKLAHTKITALKVPKNAPRFRSFVKGSEATLDIRDPSEPEKRKVSTSDFVRQIGPFGFNSDAITPELVEQIKEVAGFLKSNTDPDHWSLFFGGRASSEGSTAYNQKLANKRTGAVRKELFRQMGWSENTANYIDIISGESNATTEEKFRRVDVTVNKASAGGAQKDVDQNVAAHEAGHMFGLGDEYVEEKPPQKDTLPKFLGDKPTHYEAVKKLMGKEAADELLVQGSESIMGQGMNVKKGHYVTFLHAINQITGKSWNAE